MHWTEDMFCKPQNFDINVKKTHNMLYEQFLTEDMFGDALVNLEGGVWVSVISMI